MGGAGAREDVAAEAAVGVVRFGSSVASSAAMDSTSVEIGGAILAAIKGKVADSAASSNSMLAVTAAVAAIMVVVLFV